MVNKKRGIIIVLVFSFIFSILLIGDFSFIMNYGLLLSELINNTFSKSVSFVVSSIIIFIFSLISYYIMSNLDKKSKNVRVLIKDLLFLFMLSYLYSTIVLFLALVSLGLLRV